MGLILKVKPKRWQTTLYGREVRPGQVLDGRVESEPADRAGHGRVRERRAVAVEVGVDVVLRRKQVHVGQVLEIAE